MDREKVIKAYECCKNSYDRICEKCPYEKDCCHDGIPMFVIKKMVELLKEQERQLNEYHKADTFLAVHGFWSDNPPYGVKTSAELERP